MKIFVVVAQEEDTGTRLVRGFETAEEARAFTSDCNDQLKTFLEWCRSCSPGKSDYSAAIYRARYSPENRAKHLTLDTGIGRCDWPDYSVEEVEVTL